MKTTTFDRIGINQYRELIGDEPDRDASGEYVSKAVAQALYLALKSLLACGKSCPDCLVLKPYGHSEACQIGAALKLAEDE